MTITEYDKLPDAELTDMGMYRCPCGAAVYPNGVQSPHCEQDTERAGKNPYNN